MSWVSDWINEKRREEAEFGGTDGWHTRYFAMKEAIEEAARRVREGEVIETSGDTYYAQLGDGRATLQAAADDILAMLEDKS